MKATNITHNQVHGRWFVDIDGESYELVREPISDHGLSLEAAPPERFDLNLVADPSIYGSQ